MCKCFGHEQLTRNCSCTSAQCMQQLLCTSLPVLDCPGDGLDCGPGSGSGVGEGTVREVSGSEAGGYMMNEALVYMIFNYNWY